MKKNQRLKLARQERYRSASQAAEALGVPTPTYLAHENGSRDFDEQSGILYARRLGVSLSWLMLGVGPMKAPRTGPTPEGSDDTLVRVVAGREFDPDPEFDPDGDKAASSSEPYKPSLPNARPEIDVKPGAGLGTVGQTFGVDSKGIVTGHRVVAEWVIPPDYMRHELGARPSMIMVMQVIGDSMEPTLKHNDRVLVDISQNVFGPDAVYVIDDGDGEPRVKRLTKNIMSDPPSVSIKSDNPLAEQRVQVLLGAFRIVGRVVGRVTGM